MIYGAIVHVPSRETKLASFEFMDLFDLILLALVESRSIKSFYSLLLL